MEIFYIYLLVLVRAVFSKPADVFRKAQERDFSGQKYFFKKAPISKSSDVYVSVGIPLQNGFVFSIVRETLWQRFLKALGLAGEVQCGDREIDKAFFFAADNSDNLRALLMHDGFVGALRQIFSNPRCRGVQWDRGKLGFLSKRVVMAECTEDFIKSDAESLYRIAAEIERAGASYVSPGNAPSFPFSRAAHVYGGLHTDVLFCACVSLFTFVGKAEILTVPSYLEMAAQGEVMGVFLGFFSIVAVFRGTPWFPRVFANFLLAGIVGITLTAVTLTREMNIDFDTAEPELREMYLLEKSCALHCTTGGKKARTSSYNLSDQQCGVENGAATMAKYQRQDNICARNASFHYNFFFPWPVEGEMKKYKASQGPGAYSGARVGDLFVFPVHPGYLGLPWIRPNEIHKKGDPPPPMDALDRDWKGLVKTYFTKDYKGTKTRYARYDEDCYKNDVSACAGAAEALWEKGNKAGAKKYYLRACNLNDSRCCGILGDYALEENDSEGARRWYKMSCDMGNEEGCRRLKALP